MASATSSPDPFVGNWKLDRKQSTYSQGEPPQEITLRIEAQGENLRVTAQGTSEDDSPLSVAYSLPMKGGAGEVEHGFFDAVGSKYISETERETTYLKNGKEMMSRRTVLRDNGRTMQSTVNGTNAHGRAVSGEEVYRRE